MWGFSYNWFLMIFILQVMSMGVVIAKMGEVKVSTYSLSLLVFNIFFATMSGLSLLWWNS